MEKEDGKKEKRGSPDTVSPKELERNKFNKKQEAENYLWKEAEEKTSAPGLDQSDEDYIRQMTGERRLQKEREKDLNSGSVIHLTDAQDKQSMERRQDTERTSQYHEKDLQVKRDPTIAEKNQPDGRTSKESTLTPGTSTGYRREQFNQILEDEQRLWKESQESAPGVNKTSEDYINELTNKTNKTNAVNEKEPVSGETLVHLTEHLDEDSQRRQRNPKDPLISLESQKEPGSREKKEQNLQMTVPSQDGGAKEEPKPRRNLRKETFNQELEDAQRDWQNLMNGMSQSDKEKQEQELSDSFLADRLEKGSQDNGRSDGQGDGSGFERNGGKTGTTPPGSGGGRSDGIYDSTITISAYCVGGQRLKSMATQSGRFISHTTFGAGKLAYRFTKNATKETHTGRGYYIFGKTAGDFVLRPTAFAVAASTKMAVKTATYIYLKNHVRKEGSLVDDSVRRLMETTISKKFTSPEKAKEYGNRLSSKLTTKNILELKQVLQETLKDRGLSTHTGDLKKLLKKGRLSAEDAALAENYLRIHRAGKFAVYGRISIAKSMKHFPKRVSRSFHLLIHNASRGQNLYALEGVVLAEQVTRMTLRSVKASYRFLKLSGKTGSYLFKKTVKGAKQVKKAADKVAKPLTEVTKEVGKTSVRVTTETGKKIFMAGERFGKKVVSSSLRTARSAAVRSLRVTSSYLRKGSVLLVQTATKMAYAAIQAITSFVLSLSPAIIAASLLIIIVTVLLSFSITFFKQDSRNIEDSEDLAAQQYVDVLVDCHEKFREDLTGIYQESGYESITVDYVNEKDEDVYTKHNNEEGNVEADNNIKECMSLMSVLFDFDMETYRITDTSVQKKDDEKRLKKFLKKVGKTSDDYDGTYQKLIRSYLIGLFNGSHKVEKEIETSFCSGCASRTEEGADSETIETSYCPGHRKLHVTITTEYFDKLFDCAIKKKAESYGSINLVGSSTVEKIWNALISQGYTEEATAGIIGNLMWESGGGPNDINLHAVESNGEGVGMVQWSFGRKTNFFNFLSSKGISWPTDDVGVQLEFMLSELNNGSQWLWTAIGAEYGADANVSLETFKTCTDIAKATKYFCAKFERCHYVHSHLSTRVEWAQNVYNTYHGRSASGAGESVQSGANLTSLGVFKITYYCPCSSCSDGYGSMTSTGVIAQPNHTIAVDPSVIPYGTRVAIDGTVYVAEDCGGGVNGNHIDIYVTHHSNIPVQGVFYKEVFRVN